MKTGEVQVIESDDCYMLAVKGDISADPYYIDYLDENIRSLLKGDEFNDMLDKRATSLILPLTTARSATSARRRLITATRTDSSIAFSNANNK